MTSLELTGYVDRWSAVAGEALTFHVSSRSPEYRAQLVRLIHGDAHPAGPGVKEETIASDLDGSYRGREQPIPLGSCMRTETTPELRELTFAAWIWPTLLNGAQQCVFSHGDVARGSGCALRITPEGHVVLEAATETGGRSVSLDRRLLLRQWIFVAFAIDSAGSVHLYSRVACFSPHEPETELAAGQFGGYRGASSMPLLLGAETLEPAARTYQPKHPFNGKVSAPMVFDRALAAAEIEALAAGDNRIVARALARWDFVAEAGSTRVPDRSGNGHHGRTLNRPGRLVAGHLFSGDVADPRDAPHEYNAVHFHDDDLADAGWEPSFQLIVPETLRSGVYAVKICAGDSHDYIPFVVRTPPSKPCAPVALFLPTVTYTAYANSGLDPGVVPGELTPLRDLSVCAAERAYVKRHRLRSVYDVHSDGSGVSTATMLRPMPLQARPGARSLWNGGAHQLGADLYIVDWLEAKGIAYDVLTDHDVDREGSCALARYRAVLSGTHPEYWTGKMLDALESYQNRGGRFVYLGGNGLYWVTALSEDQAVVEIRRVHGTRSWTALPGEDRLSLTAEVGGLWRHRGRAPQRYVGIGFATQGFDKGRPYKRTAQSDDPRARFIFDGVSEELIGDFPALVSAHGAAGFELDRADPALGTPAHALVVATASGLSDCYQNAVEEAAGMGPFYGGSTCPNVRADMLFYETRNHGAVFSVGSISWCSALSYNDYSNPVSRITENVVRAFARPGPLPQS